MRRKTTAPPLRLDLLERRPEQGINQWVYQSLRRAVMCGQIAPGLALTIRGLAEMMEVSPMPVREALQRLSCEGAIEVKDNRRVVVPQMNAARFQELCNLRIVLETHAAETALPYCRHEDIKMLECLDQAVDSAYRRGDIEAGSLTNQAFHRYLYQMNPFQVSVPLIESVWLQLGPFIRMALSKLKHHYRVDRHQEALQAVRQKNAFALRRAIEADIRDGIASIQSLTDLDEHFIEQPVPRLVHSG